MPRTRFVSFLSAHGVLFPYASPMLKATCILSTFYQENNFQTAVVHYDFLIVGIINVSLADIADKRANKFGIKSPRR